MKFQTTLLILLVFILNLKCKKDKTPPPSILPLVTQEGKNTFGFKVKGEIWVPYYNSCPSYTSSYCGMNIVVVYQSTIQNKLPLNVDISLTKKYNNQSQTSFDIRTKSGMSIHTVGNKIDSITLEYYDYNLLTPYTSSIGNSPVNKIQITKLDTINKIISGVFEGVLYRSVSDSLRISEGRFDLKF